MDKITEQRIERVAAGLGRDVEASLFSIRSSSSDTELAFSGARKDYFTVEIKGNDVRVIRQVYAYSPHSPNLGTFFIRIAHHNRPWASVEFWESLEGEFNLSATCSSLGVVTFSVAMHSRHEVVDGWRIVATLTADLGQLPGIGTAAEQFFRVVGGC